MGNSQWERDWNGLHNWESRAHRLHEVIGMQLHHRDESKSAPSNPASQTDVDRALLNNAHPLARPDI